MTTSFKKGGGLNFEGGLFSGNYSTLISAREGNAFHEGCIPQSVETEETKNACEKSHNIACICLLLILVFLSQPSGGSRGVQMHLPFEGLPLHVFSKSAQT